MLTPKGIKEAEIIAQAGRLKAVTIATNMAGRGTDILWPRIWQGKMVKEGFSEELINIATAYNALEDEEHIKARQRFNELNKNLRSTDKEKEEVKSWAGLGDRHRKA